MKRYIFSLLVLLNFGLSSCYKEPDLITDLMTTKGQVAQIAVCWVGTDAKNKTNTITVDAGTSVPINVEYITEIDVKEIRLYSGTTTTIVATLPVTAAKWDDKLRNWAVAFPVNAPTAKNTSATYQTEIITTNDLASSRSRTITVKSKP
jgi:hypothetical protein